MTKAKQKKRETSFSLSISCPVEHACLVRYFKKSTPLLKFLLLLKTCTPAVTSVLSSERLAKCHQLLGQTSYHLDAKRSWFIDKSKYAFDFSSSFFADQIKVRLSDKSVPYCLESFVLDHHRFVCLSVSLPGPGLQVYLIKDNLIDLPRSHQLSCSSPAKNRKQVLWRKFEDFFLQASSQQNKAQLMRAKCVDCFPLQTVSQSIL